MWCSSPWPAECRLGRVLRQVLGLGLLLLACSALATPLLPGSQLQGEATLRYFGFRVYHAKLWTLPDFQAPQVLDHSLVLELEYFRALKGQALAERALAEMRLAGPIDEDQAQRWLDAMRRIFPDVKAGDRISALHLPGQGARFWHHDRPCGQLNDAAFARLFFSIWLAPTSSEPDMRLALLGPTALPPRR